MSIISDDYGESYTEELKWRINKYKGGGIGSLMS